MKILFTGFDAFAGDALNPSWEAVRRLPDQIGAASIVRLKLPVEYDSVRDILKDALDRERPDAVVCVGEAGGRAMITPEMVAIDLADASIPDNADVLRTGGPVVADGPAAYFSTLPVKRMVQQMREDGVPAAMSYTAGTFVCNSTMYHLLDLLSRSYPGVKGGFVHLPFLCEQTVGRPASTPSLPLETMIRGLTAIVKAILAGDDIRTASGYDH